MVNDNRHNATIALLLAHDVQSIEWGVYYNSDENDLDDVELVMKDGRIVRWYTAEFGYIGDVDGLLFAVADAFGGNGTGLFTLNLATRTATKRGELWLPEPEMQHKHWPSDRQIVKEF